MGQFTKKFTINNTKNWAMVTYVQTTRMTQHPSLSRIEGTALSSLVDSPAPAIKKNKSVKEGEGGRGGRGEYLS